MLFWSSRSQMFIKKVPESLFDAGPAKWISKCRRHETLKSIVGHHGGHASPAEGWRGGHASPASSALWWSCRLPEWVKHLILWTFIMLLWSFTCDSNFFSVFFARAVLYWTFHSIYCVLYQFISIISMRKPYFQKSKD